MDQPTHTERDQLYVMPWLFKAEDPEYGRDCTLIATMIGNEMQAVSLHAGHSPDPILPFAE